MIIDAHALKLQYELHDVNFEHWVRTAKLFIVDHYEATALVPGGSVEGAMATATALPWQEAKLFRVGSIIQESEAVRGKAMLPPDASRIREALGGRDRCASGFFGSMQPSEGMLTAADGSLSEEAAARYTYVPGCPSYGTSDEPGFIPQAWAESAYVPPHEMETMEEFNFSAMPPEAVAGGFEAREICAFVPGFCAYNKIENAGGGSPPPLSVYQDGAFVRPGAPVLGASARLGAIFAGGVLVGAAIALAILGGRAAPKLKAS